MPGTILGPGDIAVNKMDKIAFPQGVYISANLTFNRTTLPLHICLLCPKEFYW